MAARALPAHAGTVLARRRQMLRMRSLQLGPGPGHAVQQGPERAARGHHLRYHRGRAPRRRGPLSRPVPPGCQRPRAFHAGASCAGQFLVPQRGLGGPVAAGAVHGTQPGQAPRRGLGRGGSLCAQASGQLSHLAGHRASGRQGRGRAGHQSCPGHTGGRGPDPGHRQLPHHGHPGGDAAPVQYGPQPELCAAPARFEPARSGICRPVRDPGGIRGRHLRQRYPEPPLRPPDPGLCLALGRAHRPRSGPPGHAGRLRGRHHRHVQPQALPLGRTPVAADLALQHQRQHRTHGQPRSVRPPAPASTIPCSAAALPSGSSSPNRCSSPCSRAPR